MTRLLNVAALLALLPISAFLLVTALRPLPPQELAAERWMDAAVQAGCFWLLFVLAAIAFQRSGLAVIALSLVAYAGCLAGLQYVATGSLHLAETAAALAGTLAAFGAMAVQSVRSEQALVHPPLTARRHDK